MLDITWLLFPKLTAGDSWQARTCTKSKYSQFDPLRPNIRIHILHTVLCTFPSELTGEFV